jgi:hypothetical protein
MDERTFDDEDDGSVLERGARAESSLRGAKT